MERSIDEIEKQYVELINEAREIMRQVPDPKHSTSHMESIVKYTKEILKYEPNANKEVCIISAYWHDVGRIEGEKGHAIISANMLKKEMSRLKYSESFIEECYKAIYKHSWNQRPDTLEGKIIRDADKIDFIGINRWENCINSNCKFNEILNLLPSLRNDILELEISRKIYDREVANLIRYLHNIIFKIEDKK